ncbi:MAG TPA: carbohydrate ABC transporter permease [Candidatus Merdivicinus excrementipullorum]|uniref:Carbohydrate ABC transporter permease n=1 Tax=Candidatus Merdivicinus excrementipullorum TaxID=2840867 RepID=A0A9D1JY99_9FIRM|nr:carbohydrate ABC transporter permease [Candidatus Merdivicinus excrementipullorum]
MSRGDKMVTIVFGTVITLFSVACLMPFILVVIASFTDEATLVREGYRFIPSQWSIEAYKAIFRSDTIPRAYAISIFVTVVGTVMSLIITAMGAYTLSCTQVKYRNKIAFFFYFTMLFNGGMVPTYILISKYLNLRDSIWVYIIPALLNPWNMFMLRNFFNDIPEALKESARLEGAHEWLILFRIILPLSLPALATIGLFYALNYWNAWMEAMLYIDDEKLYTLQYIIMKIIRNINSATQIAGEGAAAGTVVPPSYTIRLATAIVTIGPIVFLYPFLQKYFVGGLKVGGVKG